MTSRKNMQEIACMISKSNKTFLYIKPTYLELIKKLTIKINYIVYLVYTFFLNIKYYLT